MSASADSRLSGKLLVVLYLEFALTGTVTTLLGPLIPHLMKRCAISDADAGLLIATQFAGGLVGALFANRNLRGSLIAGMPLISIGVSTLFFFPCRLSYVCTACYGVGLGLTMAAINLIVAGRQSERRASSLTLLNFLWAAGALSSPMLVEWARRFQIVPESLLGLGVIGLVLWLATILGNLSFPAVHETRSGGSWRSPSLLFFAALLFLYVGVETSVGDWTALYAMRVQHANDSVAASSVTCFWLALLSGRLLHAALLRRIPETLIYWVSLAVALAGILLYLLSHSSLQILLAAAVTALGLAPIFPLIVSRASESMLACRNSGWVFSSASLGGALVPWLTGQASARFGSLRVAFLVPASAATLIVALSLARLGVRRSLGKLARSSVPPSGTRDPGAARSLDTDAP
jgi:MFS transporter, FHS family, glucose/mannose:H+ symporter